MQTTAKHDGRTAGVDTLYNHDIWDSLCDRIANGESLRSICKSPNMPAMMSIWRWMSGTVQSIPAHEHDWLTARYRAARDAQSDALREDMQDMADDLILIDPDTGDVSSRDANVINSTRIRIQARQWIAERQSPRKYGNRQEITGPDGGPLQVSVMSYAIDPQQLERQAGPLIGQTVVAALDHSIDSDAE